ncbi:MAG: hypothetical protein JXX29_20655 [Deltaproteobacteria bacterium]|nr:hypothetical protein [Deltaproteobacteria bacterium]MBN2674104.1 hypothetical protein [Deltaproteobacteria bacterium]
MKNVAVMILLFCLGCEAPKGESPDANDELQGIPDEDTEAEVSKNLIATVEQPGGGAVYFYDLGDDGIMVAGTSLSGAPTLPAQVDISDMSVTDIYTAAGGDISLIPQKLVDAQIRADTLSQSEVFNIAPNSKVLQNTEEEYVEDAPAEVQTSIGVMRAWGTTPSGNGCNANWFLDEVDNAGWGAACDCKKQTATNRSGGGTWYYYDVHWTYAAVCPYRGRVRLRLHYRKNSAYDWEAVNGGSVVAAEGYYAWMSHYSGTWDKDYRITIAYADPGEAYHRGFKHASDPKILGMLASCDDDNCD